MKMNSNIAEEIHIWAQGFSQFDCMFQGEEDSPRLPFWTITSLNDAFSAPLVRLGKGKDACEGQDVESHLDTGQENPLVLLQRHLVLVLLSLFVCCSKQQPEGRADLSSLVADWLPTSRQ